MHQGFAAKKQKNKTKKAKRAKAKAQKKANAGLNGDAEMNDAAPMEGVSSEGADDGIDYTM